jgi:putative FmdB family regulatory protein
MPLFEYRCEECRRRFTLLVGMTAQQVAQQCPKCGSVQIRKLVSRFAVARAEDDILDDIADPSSLGDPEDPRAMADWMRKVGREMGEDLGDDFEQLVEEAVREEVDGVPGTAADDAPSTADAAES